VRLYSEVGVRTGVAKVGHKWGKFVLCWCGCQIVGNAPDENRVSVSRTSETGVVWRCFQRQKGNSGFYAWGGVSVPDVIRRLNTAQGLAIPVAEVAQRKEELYYEGLSQLKPVAEVLEHIAQQYGRIPFAVVSGRARESVQASLTALNLLDRFETLVCVGDYSKSKPDPEPFLIAAAGMASVRVPSPKERMAL
jgi:phosphoglycolate phosphatase-like HAD superfamily hydrolase